MLFKSRLLLLIFSWNNWICGTFVFSFNNVKAMKSALQRVPEKHLVSLSLDAGSLYQGNTQSNWQHGSRRQRGTLRCQRHNWAEKKHFSILFLTGADWSRRHRPFVDGLFNSDLLRFWDLGCMTKPVWPQFVGLDHKVMLKKGQKHLADWEAH